MEYKNWLLRVPEVFAGFSGDLLEALGTADSGKVLGDFRLVRLPEGKEARGGEAGPFLSWAMPVDHAWPCDPRTTDGFVEKSAGALRGKFAGLEPQTVLVGLLDGRDPWFRRLAPNLRGRVLQLFPGAELPLAAAGEQEAERVTLFCLVGRQGLYAGCASPRRCNGFFPGGRKFLPKKAEETISRAGSKIAEALHQLRLHREVPEAGSHWLELGASPGGMTAELLARGYRVTALDRAPLDKRLDGAPGLKFMRGDVTGFSPPDGELFDAMVCDMNGEARVALREALRLSRFLIKRAVIVFTLKAAGAESFREFVELHETNRERAERGGLRLLASTHLGANRHEFTWFLEKA